MYCRVLSYILENPLPLKMGLPQDANADGDRFDLSQQQGLESPARQRFPPFLVSSPRWGLDATIKGGGGENDEGEKEDLITSHLQMVPGPPRFFHRPTWRT